MAECALVAPDAVVVALDGSVWTVGRLWVAEDVLSDGVFDEIIDGAKNAPRPFRRVMDVVVHVIFAEVDPIEWNELGAGLVCAALQFCAEKSRLVSFRSLLYLAYDRVGDEDGFSFGVVFQDFCQLVALSLRIDLKLLEIRSGHVLARHHNDDLGIWQYRGVVVHVICHVANFCARNNVEPGSVRVRGSSKN